MLSQFNSWLVRLLSLLSTLACLSVQPSQAQKASAGIKLGNSWSSMIFSHGRCLANSDFCVTSASPNQPRRGFVGGAFARVGVAGLISVQPELLYVQKGYAVTEPTLHVDYIEVPVLLRADLRAADLRGVHPFLYGGPAAAIRTSCRLFASTIGSTSGDCSQPLAGVRYDPEQYDLGAIFGGGLSRRLGRGNLEMEVRYTRGLADTRAWGDAERSTNRAASLVLGYSVPIL